MMVQWIAAAEPWQRSIKWIQEVAKLGCELMFFRQKMRVDRNVDLKQNYEKNCFSKDFSDS